MLNKYDVLSIRTAGIFYSSTPQPCNFPFGEALSDELHGMFSKALAELTIHTIQQQKTKQLYQKMGRRSK